MELITYAVASGDMEIPFPLVGLQNLHADTVYLLHSMQDSLYLTNFD